MRRGRCSCLEHDGVLYFFRKNIVLLGLLVGRKKVRIKANSEDHSRSVREALADCPGGEGWSWKVRGGVVGA